MKTKYKYLLLIIFTVLASALIYKFIEANTVVEYEGDLLADQKNIDTSLRSDTNPSVVFIRIFPFTRSKSCPSSMSSPPPSEI